MKKLFIYLNILLFSVLISCNTEPKFDATTDETLEISTEKVMNSLDQTKKEKTAVALMVLMFTSVDLQNPNHDAMVEFKKRIDGKTADEVIKLAEEISEKNKKYNL
jgi:hypothetical protein